MSRCQFCGAAVSYIAPFTAEILQAAPPIEIPAEISAQPPEQHGLPSAPLASATLPPAQESRSAKAVAKNKRGPLFGPIVVIVMMAALGLCVAVGLRIFSPTPGNANQSATINPSQSSNTAPASADVSAADLSVDIYPGARELFAADRSNSADSSMISATFVSDDLMESVINFYKARMVGYTSISADGNGVLVSISPSPTVSVLVAISPAQTGGKTQISIKTTTDKSAH